MLIREDELLNLDKVLVREEESSLLEVVLLLTRVVARLLSLVAENLLFTDDLVDEEEDMFLLPELSREFLLEESMFLDEFNLTFDEDVLDG